MSSPPSRASARNSSRLPVKRQAREIDLQKLRVAAPVAGTVKHRVGVVEDVFGRQAGGTADRALASS